MIRFRSRILWSLPALVLVAIGALFAVALPAIAVDYTFTTIDVPSAGTTDAHGVNNAHEIVGIITDSTGIHGFLDTAGNFTTIDFPGIPGNTAAFGINSAGQIVGSFGAGTACR